MGKRERDKGKRGEREASKALMEALPGVRARRGVQYAGGPDSPDLVTSIPGVHLEVKRTERLSIWAALEQSQREAAAGEVPVVMTRANRKPWVVIIPLEHLGQLATTIDALQ